jgi:hypothetical protein
MLIPTDEKVAEPRNLDTLERKFTDKDFTKRLTL